MPKQESNFKAYLKNEAPKPQEIITFEFRRDDKFVAGQFTLYAVLPSGKETEVVSVEPSGAEGKYTVARWSPGSSDEEVRKYFRIGRDSRIHDKFNERGSL